MSSRPSVSGRKAKGEYIETDSGNKVSRRAAISGTPNITLAGKTVIMAEAQLRGDLTRSKASTSTDPKTAKQSSTAIAIGRCTIVCSGAVIKPPGRMSKGSWTYYPMKIGDNVFIGPNSQISSADIKSHVHIGANCVLQPFCIIRENVKILPDTIVPGGMVVPPNSVVGGRPARIIGEVGEGWGSSVAAIGSGGEIVEGGDLRELVRSIR
ncbi:uncharacterized protein PV09_08130 [Verruconis gallopava]|uniref:Dynactin subunit 5 n=1 Tax=Verruconis gallopava TaxID=253628 RepID=A0A0D2A0P7_9PEZI|nr:uncharacterized protein PV09_08130 [Verruconis gallopava]KIW00238.1 hypothetical protein PV09_08130 [Verruconis gallopava]